MIVMLASRYLLRFLPCAVVLALLAGPAGATPLGLSPGDIVSVLEWDADRINVPGDGGSFTSTGANTGDTTMDGRITSVQIQGPTTNPLSGVNFQLNASLSAVSILPLGGTQVLASLTFVGVTGDDITITDGTGTILTAELAASGLTVGGVFDTSGALVDPTAVANAVDISITGGDASLVAALGTMGTLDLNGTLFDFLPGADVILADLVVNENFVYSGSGTISPTAPAAFPEPGASLLMALAVGGLALAHGRRR